MNTPLLDSIAKPSDLKNLKTSELPILCAEIRGFLLESVSKTGGHLASNLGVIELTVALHRALSSPEDKILFDVGHQCYTHKLLTGRKKDFGSLRQLDGLSGFPKPLESEHDAFVAGHGNTSISLAIGMARAKKIKNEPGQVIAIIGDGAFTGGMVYEGMNNIDTLGNLVVILNDNTMSISKNVGAMARYLTQLRTAPKYFRAKENIANILNAVPVVGKPLKTGLQYSKMQLRRLLYHSTWFEALGFQYVGPVDGHDVARLTELFSNLRHQTAPLFIHVVTKKGKGYAPAEENPGNFHGVGSFNPTQLLDPDVAQKESFSTAFGKALTEIGKTDESICAITAAMKYGTGLQFFQKEHPTRFFDVGMAEQHAVTFAAGLASQGLRPVVALYSTFLQRSYDQIAHDVRLLNENVVFAIDRAGLVPADGETHQGIYDPAFLKQLGVATYSPTNYAELSHWLGVLVRKNEGAQAIRYARGGESKTLAALGCTGNTYDAVHLQEGANIAFVSYGSEVEDVLCAAQKLSAEALPTDCYKLIPIKPLPEGLLETLCRYEHIIFAEECIAQGGIGEHLLFSLHQAHWNGKFHLCAVQSPNLPHAEVSQIKARIGLDAAHLYKVAKEIALEN